MESAIFDTSVWINYNRGIINSQTNLLEDYISFNQNKIYTTPTIVQEYLMGVKTILEFKISKNQFEKLNIFENNWTEISISAAQLFFDLRKKGITIRKSTDCLIAQIAIENNMLLVHNDSDFDLIAENSSLKVF